MFLQDLDDARTCLSALNGTLVGVGMTAFSRIIPAAFLDAYCVIALKKTRDLPLLRERMPVFCLEEAVGSSRVGGIARSDALLAHGTVMDYLASLHDPKHLFIYQNYPSLTAMAGQAGWRLLANPASLQMKAGDRAFFMEMMNRLGLPGIPGAIHPIQVLNQKRYAHWVDVLGPELVIQLPDMRQGGGRGTFFIRSGEDYDRVRDRLCRRRWRGIALETVSIRRMIRGISASVTLCLTRHGILMSGLQRQLVDLPYLNGEPEDGIFCGHSWGSEPWSSYSRQQAADQARRMGAYLWDMGVKGIIGIDFVIGQRDRMPYPVELNPRLTGAFPMLSMLHLEAGWLPMELFHLLAFLNLPHSVDVHALNEQYARPLTGSHLLIFKGSGEETIQAPVLKPGLHEVDMETGRAVFIKPALSYDAIQHSRQFIVIDGPPDGGGEGAASPDSRSRLCHLLFSDPIMDRNGNLSSEAALAAEWVHEKLIRGTRP
ncbi:MAG: ATP-grasp domain-containing protein [Deltaproteobacteria bacterium]|nr:ATP-grasp domain-containing protein [Deltaproteobacteria bacterium]